MARRAADEAANAMAAQAMRLARPPSRHGVIVSGSWDPSQGTVQVMIGADFAVDPDDENTPGPETMPLYVPCVGSQRGPLGGERVVIEATEAGPFARIWHGPDDSPGAAAGEYVEQHRPTGAEMAFRNDARTTGDKLGLWRVIGTALHKLVTAGGNSRVTDDSTNSIVDTASGSYAAVAPEVGLGALFAALDPDLDAVVTVRQLQAALNAQQMVTQAAITALAAIVSGGMGVPPPTVADVTATGSTVTRSKS